MKKLRLAFTSAAFGLAIVFAFASASSTSNKLDSGTAYGYNPDSGKCEAGNLLQEGCGVNGFYNCTIWLDDVGPVNAYQVKQGTFSCAVALKRWDF